MVSMAASAQWQWIDKDGRKVFSDRAPPAEVLEKNILKRPMVRGTTAAPADVPAGAAESSTAVETNAQVQPGAVATPKLSGIDKALVDKKKKADEAEASKRKEEQERVQTAKAENCVRAKQAKTNYSSGMRLARINEKGQREYLDDAARASEMKRIQSAIDSDCL